MNTTFGYKTINGKTYIFAQTPDGYSIIGLDSDGEILVLTVRHRLILETEREKKEQRSSRYAIDTYYYDPLNSAEYRNTITNLQTENNEPLSQSEFNQRRNKQKNLNEIDHGITQIREFDIRKVSDVNRYHYEHVHCENSKTIKDFLVNFRPISASECFSEQEQLERTIGKDITDILTMHI